jgi:cytochrome d ubiquinol oxidase subunit I
LKDIIEENEVRVRNGIMAYEILQLLRQGQTDEFTKQRFENVKADLGYGLLLKKYTTDIANATPEQIKAAARDTVPPVAPLFWSFRIMVACGIAMFIIFSLSFYYCAKRQEYKHRILLWAAMLSLPLPWIASELGWIVAEFGRQPWTISGVLPTHLSVSSVSYDSVANSLIALISFYTLLFIIEVYLMLKFVRLGPSSLHTGRYHFESAPSEQKASS